MLPGGDKKAGVAAFGGKPHSSLSKSLRRSTETPLRCVGGFHLWPVRALQPGRFLLQLRRHERIVMIDIALEKFPISLKLRDGTAVVVRPLAKRDEAKLHNFFLAVPEEERLFIKQPIFERKMFRDWCRHIDFESNLPLLMLHGNKIIGEATLHQREGGWKRHIGLLGVLTHPGYRGRDVAKILVEEQVQIARTLGLRKLEAELNGERKVAIHALEQLGFTRLMCLEDYVLDMKAVSHDLIVMGMNLKVDEEYAGVGG
jgi:RimJ/RimL family protein N-acetyltransferase